MKAEEDGQDRVDKSLDEKLLYEHASLLFGKALHLTKSIPADSRVEDAEQGKNSYQRKNDRGADYSHE